MSDSITFGRCSVCGLKAALIDGFCQHHFMQKTLTSVIFPSGTKVTFYEPDGTLKEIAYR